MGKYKIDEDLLTDKNVVTSGKKGKPSKLYSLYIFRVLTEDADYFNPLKCTEIIDRITERFNVIIDLATIQRYINVFKKTLNDYILEGDAYDGYYLRPTEAAPLIIPEHKRIDALDVNLLVEIVRGINFLKIQDKERIIMSLCHMGNRDLQSYIKDIDSIQPIIQLRQPKKSGKKAFKVMVLENIPEIATQQKVVRISAKERVTHYWSEDYENQEMCIYLVVPSHHSSYYLVGRLNNDDELVCIRTEDIFNLEILDKTFDRTPIRCGGKYPAFAGIPESVHIKEILQKDSSFILPTNEEEERFIKYIAWARTLNVEERFKHYFTEGRKSYAYMKYPKDSE